MKKYSLLDGNTAAAWGARLSRVKVVPNFPITPQTEIIEIIAKWKAEGEWNVEFIPLDGEHSVLSAAVASQATGARTFTASSSQGLLLMTEIHYVASGMRLPLVMVNCSRGLAAPITLWSDNCDILSLRDSGWLMFFAKNNQEVIDLIIQSYKITEDRNVLLPAIINMEGFILSYTREPTIIPDQKNTDKFLPEYEPKTILDVEKPMSLGIPSMHEYMYFKSQQHKAQLNSLETIKKVFKEFNKRFKRKYDLIETYKTEDAEIIFVCIGSLSTTIQASIDNLRKQKIKAGMVRLLCYRPFPKKEIVNALKNCENIVVIDNDISLGLGGIVYHEVSSILNKKISSIIVSLGGKSVGKKDFEDIGKKLLKTKGEFWFL